MSAHKFIDKYTKDFDSNFIEIISTAKNTVSLLVDSYDYTVLTLLCSLMDKVGLMEVENGVYKMVALSVISVTQESTIIWIEMLVEQMSGIHKMVRVRVCTGSRRRKISDHNHAVDSNDLLQGNYIMVENGKKNKYLISTT